MRQIVSTHRVAAALLTASAVCAVSWILLEPRAAQAFTLAQNNVIFDPISVTLGQTLHVHVVNQLGTTPYGIFTRCTPTTPGLGLAVTGTPTTLNQGDGSDESFSFAGFAPSAGVTRIPVVCAVAVVDPSGAALPNDFSGRIASSIEIIDDATGRPTEFNASRHIVLVTQRGIFTVLNPCTSCN